MQAEPEAQVKPAEPVVQAELEAQVEPAEPAAPEAWAESAV